MTWTILIKKTFEITEIEEKRKTIEAIQFTGDNNTEIEEFCKGYIECLSWSGACTHIVKYAPCRRVCFSKGDYFFKRDCDDGVATHIDEGDFKPDYDFLHGYAESVNQVRRDEHNKTLLDKYNKKMMIKYVSKPIEIQAIQFTGDNIEEIEKFSIGTIVDNDDSDSNTYKLTDGEGMLSFFSKGDYLLKNPIHHWITTRSEEEFKRAYEKVE